MPLEALRDSLPAYASDVAQTLDAVLADPVLTEQQSWGCFLACAWSIGEPRTVRAVAAEAGMHLSPEAAAAAKAASALMGMNNVYFRTLHLLHNREYENLRSGLRMNLMTRPGVDKLDFELWAFAVSAVNGCGLCLDSHEKALRGHGAGAAEVQQALRIATVIHAVAAVLRAESAAAP